MEPESEPESARSALAKAALDASSRSRRTFMALQVFTLLVFAQLLNSPSLSWVEHRLSYLRSVRSLYDAHRPKGFPPAAPLPRDVRAALVEKWMTEYKSSCRDSSCPLPLADETDVRRTLEFFVQNPLTPAEVDARIDRWTTFRMENAATIPIPLVGLRIDGNDLGLLAGFGFLILLTWLALSLRREALNLQRLRGEPEAAARVEAYQVFTDPGGTGGGHVFRRSITLAGTLIPLLLVSYNTIVDLCTIEVGTAIAPGRTYVGIALELVSTVLVGGVAYWCLREGAAIRQAWKGLATSAVPGASPPSGTAGLAPQK